MSAKPRCRAPDKTAYPSKAAALKAIAHGAHGNQIYHCSCKQWHTTSQIRHKPKVVRK